MKKANNKSNIKGVVIIASALVLLTIAIFIRLNAAKDSNQDNNQDAKGQTQIVVDGDIVIPLKGISDQTTYYSAEIDGTLMEVLAVKASDGSIRTAFNTCQVCFNSGRGYYIQEGNVLVCQNCGNRFRMEQVEVTRGGCNPVPITQDYKTVDDVNITIPVEFLQETKVIFDNWKK